MTRSRPPTTRSRSLTNGERPTQSDARWVPDSHSFALCLTHDLDRPSKGLRGLYYALRDRPGYHLRTLAGDENPYWQFESVMALEADLGVRSAWYVLDQPHLLRDRPVSEWVDPERWVQFLGRYDVTSDRIATALRDLDAGGWEVGLHGSIPAHVEPERLRTEKERIERVLGHEIRGVRQHYLRLDGERTWRSQTDCGLAYDASLGSGETVGFEYGDRPFHPFDDAFAVFPLTAMEQAIPGVGADGDRAWQVCEGLLQEAAEREAVMTVLWHPRYFNAHEFPGYRSLYRRLVERALAMGAWVGPPGRLYERVHGETGSDGDENDSGDAKNGSDDDENEFYGERVRS